MTLSAGFALLAGAAIPSFILAWCFTAIIRRLAPRWGLVDRPNARKVHQTPIPLGGGLAIGLAVIATFACGELTLWCALRLPAVASLVPDFVRPHLPGLASRSADLWVLLGSASILMVLGLCDDRFGLDWRLRLFVQFAVALVCVITQGWRLTAFISVPQLSWILSVAMSVVWIAAMVNSFNMLDNMDGLSAGVAVIAASILALVLLLAPDPTTQRPQLFVAGFLMVLAGALCGFLWHNWPPATIFMGDAGSYFVGFCIAVATLLATYAGYQSTTKHAILAPLCVMAVPLYDMTTVIWIRLREGRSPFEADKNHFSHRLVDLGLSKKHAVWTIYLTTFTCGLGALLLHRVDTLGAALIILWILCILLLIAILESTARRNRKRE